MFVWVPLDAFDFFSFSCNLEKDLIASLLTHKTMKFFTVIMVGVFFLHIRQLLTLNSFRNVKQS